jgi:hypothetical protein
MDANKDNAKDRNDKVTSQVDGLPEPAINQEGGEFKIEIRKLEVPVRPRGVLAE